MTVPAEQPAAKPKRVMLCVEVDLDPIPGTADSPASWQRIVQGHMNRIAAHYNPTVEWIGWSDA